MKERSIFFSGPMVRAILEGRKTQMRRIVKLPNGINHSELTLTRMQDGYPEGSRPVFGDDEEPNFFSVRNPYGQPGYRLWVRETFEVVRETCSYEVEEYDYFLWDAELYGPPQHALRAKCPRGGERAIVLYRAEEEEPIERWRSPYHMPRWASRITLEVTGVRVERLQDISAVDALAEGCPYHSATGFSPQDAIDWYHQLWASINGPGSWDVNPWVWVVEFKRVQEGGVA